MGTHHAREHLSTEVPMGLIKAYPHRVKTNSAIKELINSREITIVPMVNPDGAMHDIKATPVQNVAEEYEEGKK